MLTLLQNGTKRTWNRNSEDDTGQSNVNVNVTEKEKRKVQSSKLAAVHLLAARWLMMKKDLLPLTSTITITRHSHRTRMTRLLVK